MIASAAPAAQMVSAKAGVVQYTEGNVFLDGKPLKPSQRSYSQMENGQSLRTSNGRAELLLSPNTYLRLGENGLLRIAQNQLEDTQLTLEQGCALIEVVEEIKGNRVRVHMAASSVEITKVGLYRLDSGSRELRVYGGEALAMKGNRTIAIKNGKMIRLDANLASAKFDASVADSLHKWAARRSFDLFDATKSSRKQRHWQPISMGWAHNSNYRMRFRSQRLFEEWAMNRQGRTTSAPNSEADLAAAQAQAQAAIAAAQEAAAAQQNAQSTSQPSR